MSVNINDSVPAAPTGSVNVKWQKDTSGNTSGYTTPAESVNAQTGTSYTVVAGDRATLVTFSNASAIAVTLPQATGSFTTGWYSDLRNLGVGSVTITPTTSTINGASALVLATGQSARIVSDGTNYQITNLINNANPMTTAGDIIYGGASGTPTRLAGGTSTYVLTSNGATSAPSWQAAGGGGGSGGTIPTTGWTAQNGAVWNDYLVPAEMAVYVAGSVAINWRFLTQSLSGASTYTFIGTVRCHAAVLANSSTFGFYLFDGTKLIAFEVLIQGSSLASQLRVERGNTVTTDTSTVAGATANLVPFVFTGKIVKDASHRTFYYWAAGAWTQFYQEANTAYLTETDIGVGGAAVAQPGISMEILGWSRT